MKILYVEDNQANAFLIQRVASAGNHEFFNFIDAESALDNFGRVNPDVIFVDIQLAGQMNGLDFVQVLRESGVTVPIIAITAFANHSDRDLYINSGCDEFIVKPASPEQLLDLLQTI